MANAYSILHNYDQPVYTPDFNLITTALNAKQSKLDENRGKLQSMFDQFSMLDIARGVDQEYTEDRLTKVRDLVNQSAAGDLSSDSLFRAIASNADQFIDDKVINSVVSTKRYRSEVAEWEEMKKKHPDKYSDVNRQYAMRAVQPWISQQGEYAEAGATYRGGAGFIEFTDVNKIFNEAIPKIEKMLNVKWTEIGQGNGYFRTLDTYEELSADKLNQALDGLLGQKERTQMRINGWSQYKDVPDQFLKQAYESERDSIIKANNSQIESYDSIINSNSTSPAEKEEAKRLKKQLEDYNKSEASVPSFEAALEGMGRDGLTELLHTKQFKNSFIQAYSKPPRLVDSKAYDLDVKTNAHLIKLEELDIKRQTLELQKDKLRKESAGEGVYTGVSSPATGDKTLDSVLDANEKEKLAALDGAMSVLGGDLQGKSEIKDFLSKLETVDLSQDVVTKTVNGKQVSIQMYETVNGNRVLTDKGRALTDYYSKMNHNVVDETVASMVKESIGTLKTQLAKAAAVQVEFEETRAEAGLFFPGAIDYDLKGLPNFQVRFKEDPRTGKMVAVPVTKADGDNFSTYKLLTKAANGQLTKEEEFTLDSYLTELMAIDPKTSASTRKAVQTYRQKEYGGIKTSDVMGNKKPGWLPDYIGGGLPSTARAFEDSKSWLKFSVGRFAGPAEALASFAVDNIVNTVRPDMYLSDFTSKDMEYQLEYQLPKRYEGKSVLETSMWMDQKVGDMTPESIVASFNTGLQSRLESVDERLLFNPSYANVPPSSKQMHSKLSGLFANHDMTVSSTSPISIAQVVTGDGPQDWFTVKANVGTQGTPEFKEIPIKGEVLRNNGIDVGVLSKPSVTARTLQSNPMNLGVAPRSGQDAPDREVLAAERLSRDVIGTAQQISQMSNGGYEVANRLLDEYQKYTDGEYTIQLINNGGRIFMAAKDASGNIVYKDSTLLGDMDVMQPMQFNHLMQDLETYKTSFITKHLEVVKEQYARNETANNVRAAANQPGR
jgi:hypothetical protein